MGFLHPSRFPVPQDEWKGQKWYAWSLGANTSVAWVVIVFSLLHKIHPSSAHVTPSTLLPATYNLHHSIFFPQDYISLRHTPGLPIFLHYLPNHCPPSTSRVLGKDNPTNVFALLWGETHTEQTYPATSLCSAGSVSPTTVWRDFVWVGPGQSSDPRQY